MDTRAVVAPSFTSGWLSIRPALILCACTRTGSPLQCIDDIMLSMSSASQATKQGLPHPFQHRRTMLQHLQYGESVDACHAARVCKQGMNSWCWCLPQIEPADLVQRQARTSASRVYAVLAAAAAAALIRCQTGSRACLPSWSSCIGGLRGPGLYEWKWSLHGSSLEHHVFRDMMYRRQSMLQATETANIFPRDVASLQPNFRQEHATQTTAEVYPGLPVTLSWAEGSRCVFLSVMKHTLNVLWTDSTRSRACSRCMHDKTCHLWTGWLLRWLCLGPLPGWQRFPCHAAQDRRLWEQRQRPTSQRHCHSQQQNQQPKVVHGQRLLGCPGWVLSACCLAPSEGQLVH